MKVGIIIPTYQEQDNIKKIKETFSKLKNINFFFVLQMEVIQMIPQKK